MEIISCVARKPRTHYKLLFFAAIFIRLSPIEYLVNYVGVEMKTLTSVYDAIKRKLNILSRAHTTTFLHSIFFRNPRAAQISVSHNSSKVSAGRPSGKIARTPSHHNTDTDKSNWSYEIQRFPFNTAKNGIEKIMVI